MKTFIIILCLLGMTSVYAQTKDEVMKAIDALKATGQFSDEDIAKAKKQLMQISDDDYKKIQKEAQLKSQDPTFKANVMKAFQAQQQKGGSSVVSPKQEVKKLESQDHANLARKEQERIAFIQKENERKKKEYLERRKMEMDPAYKANVLRQRSMEQSNKKYRVKKSE